VSTDVTPGPAAERWYRESRIRARLLTRPRLAGADRPGHPDHLSDLYEAAARDLGPADPLTFEVEVEHQQALDAGRGIEESALAWRDLHDRAVDALGDADRVTGVIHSLLIRHERRRGGPADLDAGVDRYRRQAQDRRESLGARDRSTHISRANLAVALRDRGRPRDLAEAKEILGHEARERAAEFGPNDPFCWTAEVVLAQTLLLEAELELEGEGERPGARARATALAERALVLIEPRVADRQRRYGNAGVVTLQAKLVGAHARILLNRYDEARTLVLYVQAVATRTRVWLVPGWVNGLLARACAPTDPATALAAARRALAERRTYYPPEAWQIRVMERLVERLTPAPASRPPAR